MQFPPDAAELLAAIATLLDDRVLGAVPADLQHPVRVAGHLARLLERESRLGPGHAAQERAALEELLGADATELEDPSATLAERIRGGDDVAFERRAWTELVEITRRDLAITKPGHDAWEGT